MHLPYLSITIDLFLQERQEKLAEKIQRKREEEERRCEELKARKQLEIQEKKKKREEKMKRVAEKQAALKKQEMEKKKKLEVSSSTCKLVMTVRVSSEIAVVNYCSLTIV